MLKKQTIPQNLNARLAKVTALEEALAEVRGNLNRTRDELAEVREDLAGSIQDRNFWMRNAQSWQRKFEQAQLERNRAIEDMVAAAAGQEIRRAAPAGLLRPGRRGAVGEDAVLFQEEPPAPAPDFNRNMWDAPARQAERPVAQGEVAMEAPRRNARPRMYDEVDIAQAQRNVPGFDELMRRIGGQEQAVRAEVAAARAAAENGARMAQVNNLDAARAVGAQVIFDMEQQVMRVAGAVGDQLADPFDQQFYHQEAEPQREDAQAGPPANAERANWRVNPVWVADPFAGPVEPEPYDPAPPEPDEDPGRADW